MSTWTIQTGLNSHDAHTVGQPATDAAPVAFLAVAAFLDIAPGIQDAWIDGDTVTLHAADDRWITMTASDDVPDADLDSVMDEIGPFVTAHQK